jgi:hypothetical protein
MSAVNDIPTGLRVPAQVPLDAKLYIANEASLMNLGISNNLAYTYYQGMTVYCVLEKRRYEWREGLLGEVGLLPIGFTYPTPLIINGVDYSAKTFNFFIVLQNVTISNIGLGASWYKGFNIPGNTHEFKTFTSTGLLITTTLLDTINIESKSGTNVGTGVYGYKGVNPSTKLHEFRTFKSMNSAISVVQVGDEIQFNATFYNTIVQGGTGIVVTGTGTALNPYIVSLAVTTSPWLTGDIKEVFCTPPYMAANFVQSGPTRGLGIGERTGWAICNGVTQTYNGNPVSVPNDNGKVIVAYGTSYPTLGATGGDTNSYLIEHQHSLGSNTGANQGGLAPSPISGNGSNSSSTPVLQYNAGDPATPLYAHYNTGKIGTVASGVDRNMQPYVVRLKIMKL